MSLNDVCVMIPAWFGVVATVFLGLLTYEGSGSVDAGIWASVIMAIIPAHIMRSVAGGFDNECVAISCLCATFYFWCRSLRDEDSWPWAVCTGIAYFCMMASWGGYVFVVNLIGVHAALLVLCGRFSSKLHRAYSLFFVIGTSLGVRIPVVGWTPLRSLEQMGPLGVFFLLQVMQLLCLCKRQFKMSDNQFAVFRLKVFAIAGAIGVVVAAWLFQIGYFGPISARVRGLFVRHTRTGNPLVDSVAEHRATSPRAYWQFLNHMCYMAPLGFTISVFTMTEQKSFMLLYALISYHFSAKMNRLVLLLGPIAASLGGVAVAKVLEWSVGQLATFWEIFDDDYEESSGQPAAKGKPPGSKAKQAASSKEERHRENANNEQHFLRTLRDPLIKFYNESPINRKIAAGFFVVIIALCGLDFMGYCWHMAEAMSSPSIILKTRVPSTGKEILIDDYREAYWWLRDTTPEDSRVLAWWDYGYQINGVANRTTLADGNTWNHEHIATLGRCLTGSEKKSHNVIRHLADYVLIWAGKGGDDLAKSTHMARIANSVYSDVCPQGPTCEEFRVDASGIPTEMMNQSVIWRLHGHNAKPGVQADPTLWEEAYTSKHGLVRIFKVLDVSQESKTWAQDPANRKCDAPGSWYCTGQYPPVLDRLLEKKKAFKQLEDFNSGLDKDAEAYQRAYMEKLARR
ncbi:unnamed protein product [Polarella glacialis]|uniref:dolichyl-diphosphooligosaccharide--protein glycotransferase n=2 Tax=Polarella glacialis TaxID=89957 RepID=A0A813HBW1_POLGL|nr:unnamed protein product [Polarella glacialis]